MALAQVKAGNTSVINEIRQIICFLYREKMLLKKYKTIQWMQQSDEIECILHLWLLEIIKHTTLVDY